MTLRIFPRIRSHLDGQVSATNKTHSSVYNIKSLEWILGFQHGRRQLSLSRIESVTSASVEETVSVGIHFRKSWLECSTHCCKKRLGILDELGSCRLHHPVAMDANISLIKILSNAGVKMTEADAKGILMHLSGTGRIRAHVVQTGQLKEA
ncbi:MAG: hypothetical protein J3Q66DRAFT_146046 [Benniella sp.]|nr:MAG: hypothetical protein J3Q66DRAFT_146046 [Benniella sp.]